VATNHDQSRFRPGNAARAALARFPLSRVSEEFHDEMLGVLPPVHIARRMAGFFVSEAVTDDVHAQFVEPATAASTGPMSRCRDPRDLDHHAAIAAFDAAHPDPPVLDWYPAEADGSVRGGGLDPVFHLGDRPCFASIPASARARRRPKCSG
jgi:hypothetical protein